MVRCDDVLQEDVSVNVSVIPYHIVLKEAKTGLKLEREEESENHRSAAPEPLKSKRENSTTIHLEKDNTS